MKIVRGNTLPDYTLLSQNANKLAIAGYLRHEAWMYKPIMGMNIAEVSGEEIYEIPQPVVEKIQRTLKGAKLISSKYNMKKRFDDGKTVIINTLTEAVTILDEKEHDLFLNAGNYSDHSYFEVQMFLLGLLIRENDNESFRLEVIRNRSAYATSGAISIFIYPTQDCNADCSYCFQKNEKKLTMTKETADNVVRYITRNVSVNDEVVFRWFGGEPLVAAEIIDHIVENVSKHFDHKLKFSSIVTTNGYAITDDLIVRAKEKWNAKKFNMTIDGYMDEHNKRKGFPNNGIDAYQKLLNDIQKLIDNEVFVVARFNCDKKNLNQYPEVLNDLLGFRESNKFHIYPTTLRRISNQPLEDYILPHDYAWFYDLVYREMFVHGFYTSIQQILPLRRRGNCMACLMNEILINAEGNLFKCNQHSTADSCKVGDCRTGVIFNQNYLNWLDVSITEAECKKCPYLPLCDGGCKSYRSENKPEVSPCVHEKYSINTIFNLVHEWVVNDGKILRKV